MVLLVVQAPTYNLSAKSFGNTPLCQTKLRPPMCRGLNSRNLQFLLFMVEAAGVEPATHVENTQLTDSENARIAENATISKSAVQSLYKDCLKFLELQPSDFPAWCKSNLKRS
jgi:hypothetical protein